MRASPAGLSKADGDHHSRVGGRAAPLPAQPAATEPEPDHGPVPVGTTTGYLLLQLLSLNGWQTTVHAHPAGVQVTARRGDRTVTRTGASVADIAVDLFKAAATLDEGDPAGVSARRGCG